MNEELTKYFITELNKLKKRNSEYLLAYKSLTGLEKEKMMTKINSEASIFHELKSEYSRYKRLYNLYNEGKISLLDLRSYESDLKEKYFHKEKTSKKGTALKAYLAFLGVLTATTIGVSLFPDKYEEKPTQEVAIEEPSQTEEEEEIPQDEVILTALDKEDESNNSYRHSNGKSFSYDVYYPDEYDGSLIVYLHGAGGGFPDNTYSLPRMIKNNEVKTNSIVVAPKTADGTGRNTFGGSESMRYALMDFIREFAERENVDLNKIVLIGHSYGADAAIRTASEFPGFFKCVVPISAEAVKGYEIDKLSQTKLMFFAGSKERTLCFNMSKLSDLINTSEGNSVFVEAPSKGHMNVCSYLFGETDLLNEVFEDNTLIM